MWLYIFKKWEQSREDGTLPQRIMLETTFRLILKSQIYSNENLHTYVTYELPKKYANKTYIILNEKSFYGGIYDLHSPLFYLDEPINLYCHSKKANLV